ncbi:MAG: hypothetical protein JOZ47_19730 [Kutzneria sp.]|nr:hypothetical protein [Kutzneria sp.]
MNRPVALGQAVTGLLMVGCAVSGVFPSPIPLLFVMGAVGTANAMISLMRTFGSALLGGVAAASVALAAVPFTTCSSARPAPAFSCSGDNPSLHLTGAVIAAALCGASLVLARAAANTDIAESIARVARQLAEVRAELRALGARPVRAAERQTRSRPARGRPGTPVERR